MNWKIIASLCLLFVLIAVAGFVLGEQAPEAQPTQYFALAKSWWPVWDTLQLGIEQREDLNRSFQTAIIQTEDYDSALAAFKEGKADAATLTIFEAILAASEGIPLSIVLLLDYTIGSDGVVAKSKIKSLQDLKGKRIGVEEGTIAHFTLLKMLEKAGLGQDEVILCDLNLDALQKSFLDGTLDAVSTYEPYMSDLARDGDGHVIFSSREMPRSICDVLFVKKSIARAHPEIIDHWIAAWKGALEFKENHTRRYLADLNRLNSTPIPQLEESFKGIYFTNFTENKFAFGTKNKPGYLFEALQEMERFMLDHGVIRQPVSLEDMIDFSTTHRF